VEIKALKLQEPTNEKLNTQTCLFRIDYSMIRDINKYLGQPNHVTNLGTYFADMVLSMIEHQYKPHHMSKIRNKNNLNAGTVIF